MDLKIFDVEHGACALLTTDIGTRLMVDCGDNTSTKWTPGKYLQALGVKKLDLLCITNYDEDHVSGLVDLESRVYVDWLARNTTVNAVDLFGLKSESGIGKNVHHLALRMGSFGASSNPRPSFPGVTYETYCNRYPDFTDENNLSMVVVLNVNGTRFLFPGDLECAGWLRLLAAQPALRGVLPLIDVFVASHHGREGGICPDVFDLYKCRPATVVISDDYHQYDTQKTTSYYASKCRGLTFRRNSRKVLTTRSDGTISFNAFSGSGCACW